MTFTLRHLLFFVLVTVGITGCAPKQNYYASLPGALKGCYLVGAEVKFCPDQQGWEPFELDVFKQDDQTSHVSSVGLRRQDEEIVAVFLEIPFCDANGVCEEYTEATLLSVVPSLGEISRASDIKAFDQRVGQFSFLTAEGVLVDDSGDEGAMIISTAIVRENLLQSATVRYGGRPTSVDHEKHREVLRQLYLLESEG